MGLGHLYAGISGDDCFCQDHAPLDQLVENHLCTTPCPGFHGQLCGGIDYTVWYALGKTIAEDDF